MEINVGKLNELPEGSYQLIDMRSDRDFEYGTIPGAIHISQEDLQGNPQIINIPKRIARLAPIMIVSRRTDKTRQRRIRR